MTSTIEITKADAVESGAEMIRVLREELAANDSTLETSWVPGAARESGERAVVQGVIAISMIPAPMNDDGFAGEFALLDRAGEGAQDIEALLAADDEFAVLCDERRDAWLARVENEDDTCDE